MNARSSSLLTFALAGAACAALPVPMRGAQDTPPFQAQEIMPRGAAQPCRFVANVVTEFPAGAQAVEGGPVRPPSGYSPERPLYYVGLDEGRHDEGAAVGGERPPEGRSLASALQRALAVNGMLAADGAHAPDAFVSFRWGAFNVRHPALLVDGLPIGIERREFVERIGMVGGARLGVEAARALDAGTFPLLAMRDPRVADLISDASNNLYYIVVLCHDMQAANHGERKLLWRTKISTRSQGLEMDDALPLMVRSAAPWFGRTTSATVRCAVNDGAR